MKVTLIIFLLLCSLGCAAQTSADVDSQSSSVSYGIALDVVDSALYKDIRFVHFDSCLGAVFPAAYSRKKFSNTLGWENYRFFTPDTVLIKQVDRNLIGQFCEASMRFNDANWRRTISELKEAHAGRQLRLAKKQKAYSEKRQKEHCPRRQKDLIYWDRQYAGIVNATGEKMIYVQFLDFRSDPANLRLRSSRAWIDGWHGWFETNVRAAFYHVDKNLLTINEDL